MASETTVPQSSTTGFGGHVIFAAKVAALVFVITTFVFQTFTIPSTSMVPALQVGDRIAVTKFAYGYSRYSVPFVPVPINGRVFGTQPNRGDVVVFKGTGPSAITFVKRLIGLPGDTLQMRDGRLFINGQAVKRTPLKAYAGPGLPPRWQKARQYREILPNGVAYSVIDLVDGTAGDNTKLFTVPEGHYFMLGDNRDNSSDSRFSQAERGIGFIPFDNLIGRADRVLFSTGSQSPLWEFWNWGTDARPGRFWRPLSAKTTAD